MLALWITRLGNCRQRMEGVGLAFISFGFETLQVHG